MFFWKFVSPRSSLALITAAASTVPTPTLVSSFQRNSCSIGGGKAKRANTFPSLLGGWTAPSTASCTNPSRGFFHRVERTFGGFASTARFQPWYYRQTSSTRTMSLSAGSSSADSDTGRQSRSSASSALVRVALLQFHVTEDKALNIETARNFILRAKDQNASMVVLPEVWNSPYATSAFAEYAEEISVSSVEDDDGTISTGNPSVSFLLKIAKDYGLWIIGGSIPEKAKDPGTDKVHYYNTCLCINPQGTIVAKHQKVHLFDIDIPNKITFRESDTLTGGSSVTTFDALDGIKVGVGICYDIRFPELSQLMVQRGCNLLVFPGAFNLVTGPAHWELLQRARAVDCQCFVLTASPARLPESGTNGTSNAKYPPYFPWGHSTAVNPWGEVIATCDEKDHIVICDLDMSKVEEVRQSVPTRFQKRSDLYKLHDMTK
jgi:omega-amidase